MIEIISGIATALLVIIITRSLSPYFPAKLIAATILCSIAFIYVGFSLKGNTVGSMVLEISLALVLYFIAIIGYIRNNYLIAFGIIFHGIWDILHHNALLIPTEIPLYWPVFCFIIDIIDGLYFLMIFRRQKRIPGILPSS